MMDLMFNFIDRFIPASIRSDDSHEFRQYRTLILLQLLIFPVVLFYIPDSYFKNLFVTIWGLLIFFFFGIVSIVTLIKFNRYSLAAHIFTFGLFFNFYVVVLASGFTLTSQMSWFFLFPIVPTILLSKRGAILWTAFSSALVIGTGFYVFNISNYSYNEYSNQLIFDSFSADFILGPVLVYLLTRSAYNIQEQAITQLSESHKQLNQAYFDKREILSILFHDLNNHIFKCSFHLHKFEKQHNILADKEDECKLGLNTLKHIEISINEMSSIIKDVKLLEQYKSGKIELTLEPVDLEEIYNEALLVFEEKLLEKNINLKFDIAEMVSPYVLAEKVSFKNNVFFNILSNAIKFSLRNSSIEIKIKAILDDEISISILDYGMGIPDAMVEDLFSFDKATSRKGTIGESGTGFGMPIVKSTLERFNAKMSITSQAKEDGFEDTFTCINIILKKYQGVI